MAAAADAETYARMQSRTYEYLGNVSKVAPGIMMSDHVVGSFEAHNQWPDNHVFLLRHSKLGGNTTGMLALDFACGPGRNILLFNSRFKRVDGVDIAEENIKNAKVYTSNLPVERQPQLYKCNGLDLKEIPDDTYDVIFSTIAFQHICCHSIRLGYMKEFLRVLKPGGFVCIQMGYGRRETPAPPVGYYENSYDAPGTNSGRDTRVDHPSELEGDLTSVGFKDFEYNIRPAGPGDFNHANWIYWAARKPE